MFAYNCAACAQCLYKFYIKFIRSLFNIAPFSEH